MARTTPTNNLRFNQRVSKRKARVSKVSEPVSQPSLLQKLQQDLNISQSALSLALGGVIVLVAGLLLFNYFKGQNGNIGPASQTADETMTDVSPSSLPGKYTVKEGDTLFKIADFYYKDGYQFDKISEANKLSNVNSLTVGQVLQIPKLETTKQAQQASPAAPVQEGQPSPSASPETSVTAQNTGPVQGGKGGAENQTIWGEKITGTTYVVQMGDWLSKIAGRAYGDVMAFDKIAKANKIDNPDLIEPGQTLQIPR